MKINPAIQALNSQSIANHKVQETKEDFSKIFKEELGKVNQLQVKADQATQEFIIGESQDIHSVMLATEEAKLALEMAVQVRNKLIEAYQEINRMQL